MARNASSWNEPIATEAQSAISTLISFSNSVSAFYIFLIFAFSPLLVKEKLDSTEPPSPCDNAYHSFEVLQPMDKTKHGEIMKNEQEYKRYSRGFNIDLAAKILFSNSISVDNLIKCQVASYLEFNNVNENFFYNPSQGGSASLADDMVKIPFSKSEIFVNKVLTFKEKRQLVKVIEYCLFGSDRLKQMEEASSSKKKPQNSTHVYDKDTSLSQAEQ